MILIILKLVLCSFLFLGIYHLVLAKTALHRFKRIYLLFSLLISLAIPFINVELPMRSEKFVARVETLTEPITFALEGISDSQSTSELKPEAPETVVSKSTETSAQDIRSRIDLSVILAISFYGLITLGLLFRLARNIFKLLQKVKTSEHADYKGIKVIILQGPAAPFSFLNYIFISKTDFENITYQKYQGKKSKILVICTEEKNLKMKNGK